MRRLEVHVRSSRGWGGEGAEASCWDGPCGLMEGRGQEQGHPWAESPQ